MLGVFGAETQHLVSVHDGLAQAKRYFNYTVLGLFVAYGVEVQRTGHSRYGREIVSSVLASADFLDYDAHFLFRYHIASCLDI